MEVEGLRRPLAVLLFIKTKRARKSERHNATAAAAGSGLAWLSVLNGKGYKQGVEGRVEEDGRCVVWEWGVA